jgi:hypothetical protein
MRCEFNDGFQVSYSGPLRIKKGDEVYVFLSPDDIADELPVDIQGDLREAALHENCSELRRVAQEVTDIVGSNIPEQ